MIRVINLNTLLSFYLQYGGREWSDIWLNIIHTYENWPGRRNLVFCLLLIGHKMYDKKYLWYPDCLSAVFIDAVDEEVFHFMWFA